MVVAHTAPLRHELEQSLPERPFTVELWDGSTVQATADGGPTLRLRSPRAVAQVLRAPGQLGLGRAYVSGALDADDLDAMLPLLDAWKPPPIPPRARARLVLAALRAVGVTRPPPRPAAELAPSGRRHSPARDARAVRHHYDLPAAFFALFLDASMTYSCAIFSRGATTLEQAQEAKLELVCRKLELRPGERVLDVGCGWGSFALHAAGRHGAHVTGITLSPPQAEVARWRAREEGLSDRVDIRVADYRELGGERFDAVASIGMVEHVGEERLDAYAAALARVLAPGGRLLNHGIARLRHGQDGPAAFTDRYIFPDGVQPHLSKVLGALERAGFVTEHVEGFADDYAETLRQWAIRFDEHLDEARRLGGDERVRVWRLYLRGARHAFEAGDISIYQARCRRG